MDIFVDYNEFEARFSVNNSILYQGIRTTKRWRYLWHLFDANKNIVAEIKLNRYIIKFGFNEEYHILVDELKLILQYKAFKAPHYIITLNNDHYKIIVHKGNQLSFFKNDQQFAALSEQRLNIGTNKKMYGQADNNIDIRFLTILIYTIKCTLNASNDGSINLNLGNIGPELKKFNSQWVPKI